MCPEEEGRLLGENFFENVHLQDQKEDNVKVGYILRKYHISPKKMKKKIRRSDFNTGGWPCRSSSG
jgi:hypothetical protein